MDQRSFINDHSQALNTCSFLISCPSMKLWRRSGDPVFSRKIGERGSASGTRLIRHSPKVVKREGLCSAGISWLEGIITIFFNYLRPWINWTIITISAITRRMWINPPPVAVNSPRAHNIKSISTIVHNIITHSFLN